MVKNGLYPRIEWEYIHILKIIKIFLGDEFIKYVSIIFTEWGYDHKSI